MVIQAHLTAKSYGTRPSTLLRGRARDFWLDARVRAAGLAWEQDQRDRQRSSTTAGVATDGERADLADQQDDLARRREAADGQPDPSDQLASLRGP